MILGVIGKIGSGKSEVARYLNEQYKAKVFYTDDVAREIICEEGLKKHNFENIFIDEKLQEEVRNSLHKVVFERIFKNIYELCELKNLLIVVETALPNDYMMEKCDKTLYIDSPYELRVDRLKKSREYPEDNTKLIYDSQKYYERFYDKADYKIINDGSVIDLHNKVDEVINEIYIVSK